MADVIVYGAGWCPSTQDTIRHLKGIGVQYKYIDIDDDRKAARWVAQHNGGKEKKPTIDVGGEVLSTPSNEELDRVLAAKGITT
ncbi:MAG TPA: glutaredoxin family protein [Bryobacteraceae bacterium]|nr:glutaredoxin family protein [Bryobacteraceae bacterium]